MPVAMRDRPAEIAGKFGINYYARAAERGLTVSQLLEEEDPSREWDSDPEFRGTEAFERVLNVAGIATADDQLTGTRATLWADANNTAEKRALMHEWAARVWRKTRQLPFEQQRAIFLSSDNVLGGIEAPYSDDTTLRSTNLAPPIPLSAIVARESRIEGEAYRTLYLLDALGTDAYRMKRVTEGSEIPTTILVTGEHLVRIFKFGRAMRATYEQLRRERIDRIQTLVQRMAIQAEADKVSQGMGVIINGDGNANTAAVVLALTTLDPTATAGTLTLEGWLTFKAAFGNAYRANTLLAQQASMLQVQLLPVNTVNGTPLIMLPNFAGGLTPINDLYGGVIRYGQVSDAPALKLVAFDATQTLEMVTEIGGEVSEVEKFITNQTQVLTLSEVVGFGIVDPQASRILNINA
jgi:hypothetical protein